MTNDAHQSFGELVSGYPSSIYLPRALLAFGEYYYFQRNDMETAQSSYERVAPYQETSFYPYVLYQQAWCSYNSGDYTQAMQRLLDVFEASSGSDDGHTRMRRRAQLDLVLFYPEFGQPNRAFDFFEEVVGGEAPALTRLLADLLREDGQSQAAESLMNELRARD